MRKVSVRRHIRRRPEPIYAVHRITAGVPESRLRPRARRSVRGFGAMYGIDEMLGDDQYVFLMVEQVFQHWGAGDAYLFNARELIRRGAKWREKDILDTTEATNLLLAYKEWSRRQGMEWYPNWDTITADSLREAIGDSEWVAEKWGELKRKAGEITHSGKEAIGKLEGHISEGEFGPDLGEVLVPRSLPLGKSVGVVLDPGTRQRW